MQTAPFRAALWTLGLAFLMAMLMLVPNPQRVRLALRPRPEPSQAGELLMAGEGPARERSSPPPAENGPDLGTAPVAGTPQASGVRVASADPSASLGFYSASEQSEQSPAAVAANPCPDPPIEHSEPNVPVPDPIGSRAIAPPPVPLPSREVSLATLHSSEYPSEESLSHAVEKIAPAPPQPDPLAELGITATPSSQAGRIDFRFDRAPLPKVLEVLGEHAGWPILTTPEIQGEYSAEFPKADAHQILALVIKLHGCSVQRRGPYYLIGKRELPDGRTTR